MADIATLEVTTAGSSISKFNSGRGLRCFCSNCGSPVWFESLDYPEIVGIPLGALDSGDIPPPEVHLWTQSNPTWCDINDDLPRHKTHPAESK